MINKIYFSGDKRQSVMMNSFFSSTTLLWFANFVLFLAVSTNCLAEDVEIFQNETIAGEPNILLILDNSGSMTNTIVGSSETRMDALNNAFNSFIWDPDLTGINIGLMAFSNNGQRPTQHGISVPISPIDDEILPIMGSNLASNSFNTGSNFGFWSLDNDNLPNPSAGQGVRSYLPDVLASWTASLETPIVDSLYEAALYFKGMPPKSGAASAEQNHAAHPSSYAGTILSELRETLTGKRKQCDEPNCGINCEVYFAESDCEDGQTSCHTGNNCGSKSCETSCTSTCPGTKDIETGQCSVDEVRSCTTDPDCPASGVIYHCDRQKYICDEVANTKVNTLNDAVYRSPITQQCQNNAIILLSDGEPDIGEDQDGAEATRSDIKSLIGRATDCAPVVGQVLPTTDANSLADGRCGPELAQYLSTVDQSDVVEGDNFVKTYTVGFAVEDRPTAKNYLQSLSDSGGGKYFSAVDSVGLVNAFKSILNETVTAARSFSTPVYTVDPASTLVHSNDIYLPLFENTAFPGWSGNLKKFKLDDDGSIIDANGEKAIDSFGRLKPTAVDFWMPEDSTLTTTSNPITDGGVANNLNPTTRNLKVDKGNRLVSFSQGNIYPHFESSSSSSHKSKLFKFLKGFEEDGITPRSHIGDILHSKPTLISYNDSQVLFFGTNEGYLHAFDAADASDGGGQEKFAFMPSSLVKNTETLFTNEIVTEGLTRVYGVDGEITAFIQDEDKNGKVNGSDKAMLVFGLRRGGSEYYALDVTNPDDPTLKWKISSGGDFSQLGETWSKPTPAKLRYLKDANAVLTDVLVFGGGYDNRLDESSVADRTPLSSGKGNAVYIVDAESGELIWSLSGGQLKDSIPSSIRAMDIDRDGSIDRLYFGDTGGNIWRVDLTALDNEEGKKRFDVVNNSKLHHFASLGGTGADSRKFFFEPDVSIFKHSGQTRLVVSIGSGYRARPLNADIEDRFYVLNDENVMASPESTMIPIRDTDLRSSSSLSGESFLPGGKGWFKTLENGLGEKALSTPLTFNGRVMFTTFAVVDSDETSIDDSGCAVTKGNMSSAYVLDLMSGAAAVDLNDNGFISSTDESVVVPGGDILGTPQLVFNAPSNCTTDGCDQIVDIRTGNKLVPLVGGGTAGGGNNIGEYLPKVFWLNKH